MSEQSDPRILFAAQRTLLAWQRSSIALIAFGFLIERSGLLATLLAGDRLSASSMYLTLAVGLVFIGLGVFVALYSSREYGQALKSIRPVDFPPDYGVRWGMGINLGVALLGSLLALGLVLGY